jgi:hypothetical protein
VRGLRAALALGAIGLLAACGPGNSVVMEPAAPVAANPPGSGGDGGSGGSGGQGANADDSSDSSSDIDPALARCIHRFDDIPAIGSDDPRWKAWYHAGSQDNLGAVGDALDKHFGSGADMWDQRRKAGWLDIEPDPVRSQIVVLVDASLVDTKKLGKQMTAVVEREREQYPKRSATKVAVVPSCFPAAALVKARKQILAEFVDNRNLHYPSISGIRLDSRLPVGLGTADRAEGERLEQRYGAMIKITYSNNHDTPL